MLNERLQQREADAVPARWRVTGCREPSVQPLFHQYHRIAYPHPVGSRDRPVDADMILMPRGRDL